MKVLKKALALVLALCVAAAFFPAAFADDVTQTVTVTDTSETVDGSVNVSDGSRYGTNIHATTDNASLQVNGDVSVTNAAKPRAVYDEAEGGNSSTVSIQGDVSATGTEEAVGVIVYAHANNSHAEMTVGGNVSASAPSAVGVYLKLQQANASDSSEITVDGSVKAEGDTSVGLEAKGLKGTSTITVKGDVTAGTDGIKLSNKDGKVDILVEGTVSGGDAAVVLDGVQKADKISLTLWKAELSSDQDVVKQDGSAAAETVQNNILYIIKLDESAADVSLSNTTSSHDHNCAKENTVVTLDSLPGKTVAVFNNDTRLERNDDGKFFLVVPRGGGVYLRLELASSSSDGDVVCVLVTVYAEDGTELNLCSNKRFVMTAPDGTRVIGSFDLVDGLPVFTAADGSSVSPTANEDGCAVALPLDSGKSESFQTPQKGLDRLAVAFG